MNRTFLVSLVSLGFSTFAIAQEAKTRTIQEFTHYVAGKLPGVSDEMLDAIAAAVDKNGDGKVGPREFAGRMAAMRTVLSGGGATEGAPSRPARRRRGDAPKMSDYMDGTPKVIAPLVPGSNATILLIAGDELAEAWVPFAEWKSQQGRATKIVTVREIARAYEAKSIQEKIRLCVREHIEKHGTRWVILGGDSQPGGGSVPGGHTTYHSQEPGGIPTDIVYLSPTDWDADGDGRYGEWQDDRAAITYPDGTVGLGRVPVRTVKDVSAFTDKVIAYESNFPESDVANKMLFTCTESMATAKVRASWDKHLSKAWSGTVERYFPDSQQPTVSRVQAALAGGSASKVHVHGHGTIGAWQLSDADLTKKHIDEMSDANFYPLVTTVSCNTGEYDSQTDPSIVESVLRAPKAGSVAIVAPIRTGKMHLHDMSSDFDLMVNEGKLDGTTAVMTSYWLHGLGKQRTTGEALMFAKADLVADARKTAGYHLCICELNLLGDPTLDFRASVPRRASIDAAKSVPIGRQTVAVKTDAPGATVSFRQGAEILQVHEAAADGVARFDVDITSSTSIDVTVSGANLNTSSKKISVTGNQK